MIKHYNRDTMEYKALETAAAMLTAVAKRTTYRVEDTYFDFGAGLKWTTVIAYRDDGSTWQALMPREHDMILAGDIRAAVELVVTSKYNPDR